MLDSVDSDVKELKNSFWDQTYSIDCKDVDRIFEGDGPIFLFLKNSLWFKGSFTYDVQHLGGRGSDIL